MIEKRYVIGLDQSTQGTKAILLDATGKVIGKAFLPHEQIVNDKGWVSHDGEVICRNSCQVIRQLVEIARADKDAIAAIGISNQRETTIAWDRVTGRPVDHAIVWQCARAKEITAELTDKHFREIIRKKTGIPLSPYFPAAKAAWILRHNQQARQLAGEGRLCIGTMDSWLIFKLTGGSVFKTDYSNASRTQLFNLHTLTWDEEICGALGIPTDALAAVESSDGSFDSTTLGGYFETPVPIHAVLGDSHAALFGQGCVKPGMAKATYGTGSSIMMNIGGAFQGSRNGLVTSLAWGRGGKVEYVLEGNINYAGAVITWLQKDLGLVENAQDTETLAEAANPEDGTYLVPAFSGLGAPYWNEVARAAFCGMSRTTGRKELVKAGLECIAYQVTDIVEAMAKDSGLPFKELRVDGGPTANGYLMQFQSDMLQGNIRIPAAEELSAIGAATMAGIGVGFFAEDLLEAEHNKRLYEPQMDENRRNKKYAGWKNAIEKLM